MITGATATVFVSDMSNAVKFYTDALGLKLRARYGDHYAEIDAGGGATIGLHPRSPKAPAPGTPGAIQIGLTVRTPLEPFVAQLQTRGVKFDGPIQEDPPVRLAFFGDPDGNTLYLCQTAF